MLVAGGVAMRVVVCDVIDIGCVRTFIVILVCCCRYLCCYCYCYCYDVLVVIVFVDVVYVALVVEFVDIVSACFFLHRWHDYC